MNHASFRLFSIFIGMFVISGCSEIDGHAHETNLSGKALYEIHCADCHQASGKGKFLKGVPPSKYTHLTTRQLIAKIMKGSMSKSKMAVFKNMPRDEAKTIATYVKQKLSENDS